MIALALVRIASPLASATAAAALLAACASGPTLQRSVVVEPGAKTVVRYVDVKGTLSLSLQNDSAAAPAKVYGADTATIDPGAKVVVDEELQALLDVFTESGLFAGAANEVPPDALDALVVDQQGRRWVFARRLRGMQQAEAPFHEGRAYFLALYNSVTAYHGAASDRPNFKAEQSRTAGDGRTARQKLEDLRRSKR
jgi:hypothetical protein